MTKLGAEYCPMDHVIGSLQLSSLKEITIRGRYSFQSAEWLRSCTNLKKLHLEGCAPVDDLLSLLSACPALEHLTLKHHSNVVDLAPLASCDELRHVELIQCDRIDDLSPLASCKALQKLKIQLKRRVVDLRPLASCASLQFLDLQKSYKTRDLAPLASCTALRYLDLSWCPVTDLRPLLSCTGLEELHLLHCDAIKFHIPLSRKWSSDRKTRPAGWHRVPRIPT